MLADPIREKLMNAFADSDLDCSTWEDSILEELADLCIKTIVDELTRGINNAKSR